MQTWTNRVFFISVWWHMPPYWTVYVCEPLVSVMAEQWLKCLVNFPKPTCRCALLMFGHYIVVDDTHLNFLPLHGSVNFVPFCCKSPPSAIQIITWAVNLCVSPLQVERCFLLSEGFSLHRHSVWNSVPICTFVNVVINGIRVIKHIQWYSVLLRVFVNVGHVCSRAPYSKHNSAWTWSPLESFIHLERYPILHIYEWHIIFKDLSINKYKYILRFENIDRYM